MSRRIHPTLADYLVIAVSPALIMTLIGSLAYFLIEVFYRGQFVGRLHLVVTLFVFAAVLIGRIGIEFGSAHAMNYAAPLALVTVLALGRFVEYPGAITASSAVVFNSALVGLILWSAYKLTWDCTFIDESEEASGEGLLQTIGLDPPAGRPSGRRAGSQTTAPETQQEARKPKSPEKPPGSLSPDRLQAANQATGPAVPQSAAVQAETGVARKAEATKRPHAGGIWVVYFSLAALPIFGLGQQLVPAQELERRRYLFQLLCVYTASALGLLLTTSFLGLRRYLRSRRLRMPAAVAGSWVAVGSAMIVAVLGFAMLLPRPSPEYAISKPPWQADSPHRGASRYAVGREGTHDATTLASTGEDRRGPNAAPPANPTSAPQAGAGTQEGRSEQGAAQPKEQQAGGPGGRPGQQGTKAGAASGGSPQGKGPAAHPSSRPDSPPSGPRNGQAAAESVRRPAASKEPSPKDPSPATEQTEQKAAGSEDSREQKGGSDGASTAGSGGGSGAGRSSQGAGRSGNREGQTRQAEPSRGSESRSTSSSEPSRTGSPPSSPAPSRSSPSWRLVLDSLVKWVLYAALVVAVLIWVWRCRHVLAHVAGQWLEAWREFWARWFGRRRPVGTTAASQAGPPPPTPPPLLQFVDPFATGQADRWSADELVRYSFAAMEAWAREHHCPRRPEQTPHEFADQVGARSMGLARHGGCVAELYSQVAYAPGTLDRDAVRPLRAFWQALRAEMAAQSVPAPALENPAASTHQPAGP